MPPTPPGRDRWVGPWLAILAVVAVATTAAVAAPLRYPRPPLWLVAQGVVACLVPLFVWPAAPFPDGPAAGERRSRRALADDLSLVLLAAGVTGTLVSGALFAVVGAIGGLFGAVAALLAGRVVYAVRCRRYFALPTGTTDSLAWGAGRFAVGAMAGQRVLAVALVVTVAKVVRVGVGPVVDAGTTGTVLRLLPVVVVLQFVFVAGGVCSEYFDDPRRVGRDLLVVSLAAVLAALPLVLGLAVGALNAFAPSLQGAVVGG